MKLITAAVLNLIKLKSKNYLGQDRNFDNIRTNAINHKYLFSDL